MRFYFAVKHNGVWRVAEGLYDERMRGALLWRAEREVLETIGKKVAEVLEWLGLSAEVGEPKEERDKEGDVVAYYLHLYSHHLTPLLQQAAESVRAEPADLTIEGRHIAVRASGAEAAIEFKLLKGGKAVFLLAQDVVQTLALYKSLKALGVPVELTPKGVRVDSKAMWAIVAAAVKRAIEKAALSVREVNGYAKLVEFMPGVELASIYNAGGSNMYIFRVFEDDAYYYLAVKTGEGWKTAGGKYRNRKMMIYGETASTIAETINAIYRERGIDRRVEARRGKDGTCYIYLTNIDLELLGLTWRSRK